MKVRSNKVKVKSCLPQLRRTRACPNDQMNQFIRSGGGSMDAARSKIRAPVHSQLPNQESSTGPCFIGFSGFTCFPGFAGFTCFPGFAGFPCFTGFPPHTSCNSSTFQALPGNLPAMEIQTSPSSLFPDE
jgi:hypothetical protein